MAHQHSARFLQIVNDAKKRVKETTVDKVKAKLDRGEKFHLVDVREESEFAKDHLPKALHLGKGVIERDVEQRIPDPAAEVVLYCGGGFRSALAADNLQKMGYTNVISMDGGIRDWRGKGYPPSKGGSLRRPLPACPAREGGRWLGAAPSNNLLHLITAASLVADVRQDVLVDVRLVLELGHLRDELPVLDVLDGLAGGELHHRAERLHLEHVLVGERLEVDAVVGVGLAVLVLEPLDEQLAVFEVADPAHLVGQADLRRPLLVVLPKRGVLAAEGPARVLE